MFDSFGGKEWKGNRVSLVPSHGTGGYPVLFETREPEVPRLGRHDG